MSTAPAPIPEGLRRNEEKRLALQQARQSKLKEEGTNFTELVGKFNHDYGVYRLKILNHLALLKHENVPKDKLPERFDAIIPKLTELQEILNSSVFFLPPFEIRVAREGLIRLEEQIAKTRQELLPRTQFKFRDTSKTKMEHDYKRLTLGQESSVEDDVNVDVDVKFGHESDDEDESAGLSISDLSNEIVYKSQDSLPLGSDFAMSRLNDCVVSICAPLTALRLYELRNCRVYTGAVMGSLHMENCDNCVIITAVHQARIHHTHNTDFYIHSRSGPIIEHCTKLGFAPYILQFDGLEDQLVNAKLGFARDKSKYYDVQDFRWLRIQKSPNWEIIPESRRVPDSAVKPISSVDERERDDATYAKYRQQCEQTGVGKEEGTKGVNVNVNKNEDVESGSEGKVEGGNGSGVENDGNGKKEVDGADYDDDDEM